MLHGIDRPTDLIKTANMLFGTFEAFFMWDFVARKFEKCCQERAVKSDGGGNDGGNLSVSELCKLVDFLLDIVVLVSFNIGRWFQDHSQNLICVSIDVRPVSQSHSETIANIGT